VPHPALPIVCQLTPPGRGAVATLSVEGPGALASVQAHFRAASGQPLESFPADRLVFGRFGGGPGEEVVVRVRSGEAVEVHCHAGQAAPAMVLGLLVQEGCRPSTWQERAAAEPDPIRADALIALAQARTERAAAILLDQYHGALRRAIDAVGRSILSGDTASARRQVQALLARAAVGRHLVEPWRVVLAGPPNVGKSSLVNALVGYRRAIVDPSAGTTRDVVSAMTALEGWPVEFSDTAGLRPTQEPLEKAGVALAEKKLADADLVVLVFDLSAPWSPGDEALMRRWPRAIVVHNKADLPRSAAPARPEGLVASALSGDGIDPILSAVVGQLVPECPPPGGPVPFAISQFHCLEAIEGALLREETVLALDILGKMGPSG